MAYTVDQLCTYVAQVSGMSSAAGSDDRALMDQWVNDAMVEVFLETSCVITQVTVGLTAGVDEYSLDTGILRVLEYAQLASSPSSTLTVTTAEDLLQRRFTNQNGTVRRYAVMGGNVLLVSPAPAAADDIEFWAVPYPDTVATTTDIHSTGLPLYARRAIQCFMLWKAAEGNDDLAKAQYWEQQFRVECGRIRKRGRDLGGRKLAPSRIGYPDTWRVPSRNDTYPEST
jgi:hypothetical protein